MSLDVVIFRFVNDFAGRNSVLDTLGVLCATYLIWVMTAGLLGMLAYELAHVRASKDYKRRRTIIRIFTNVGIAMLLAFVGNVFVGKLLFRSRPFVTLDSVVRLIERSPLEKSFPSDHATLAFALAFSVAFFDRKWGVTLLGCAFVVSLGRIFVGVHYPSDVIAGAVVGLFWASVVYLVDQKRNLLTDQQPHVTSFFTKQR